MFRVSSLSSFTIVFCVGYYLADECPDQPNASGFLPDRTNCSRFHMCHANIKTTHECPHPLKFNWNLNVCDFEERVELPDDYCEYSDMIYEKPHFCDCKKYVYCNYGAHQVMDCPAGYYFNLSVGIIPYVSEERYKSRSESCQLGNCQ